MAEYIEREAAIEKCREIVACEWNHRASPVSWADAYEQFAEDIEELQSADVAPIRHGMWETIDASTWRWSHDGAKPVHRVKYRHNECGRVVQRKEPYCPNCGCNMDLEG